MESLQSWHPRTSPVHAAVGHRWVDVEVGQLKALGGSGVVQSWFPPGPPLSGKGQSQLSSAHAAGASSPMGGR